MLNVAQAHSAHYNIFPGELAEVYLYYTLAAPVAPVAPALCRYNLTFQKFWSFDFQFFEWLEKLTKCTHIEIFPLQYLHMCTISQYFFVLA